MRWFVRTTPNIWSLFEAACAAESTHINVIERMYIFWPMIGTWPIYLYFLARDGGLYIYIFWSMIWYVAHID